MIAPNIIEWRDLRDDYISRSVPIEQVIIRSPELRLVYDPVVVRLGMRLRLEAGRHWSSNSGLKNVATRLVMVSGVQYVEVSTNSKDLFRPIYLLIGDVVSRLVDGEQDSLRALDLSLSDFESLVAKSAQMSEEKAIGLYGELLVLRELLDKKSGSASSWIGASGESHDFRLGAVELEVKTTTANVRVHKIHGLNQLCPTPGHALQVISIRIGSPGSGTGQTVNDLVALIRTKLCADESSLKRFNQCLDEIGYDSEHAACLVKYQLVGFPTVISIGTDFPIMSYEWLSKALGAAPSSRIRDVDLTLDLEGLGSPFDAAQYRAS